MVPMGTTVLPAGDQDSHNISRHGTIAQHGDHGVNPARSAGRCTAALRNRLEIGSDQITVPDLEADPHLQEAMTNGGTKHRCPEEQELLPGHPPADVTGLFKRVIISGFPLPGGVERLDACGPFSPSALGIGRRGNDKVAVHRSHQIQGHAQGDSAAPMIRLTRPALAAVAPACAVRRRRPRCNHQDMRFPQVPPA